MEVIKAHLLDKNSGREVHLRNTSNSVEHNGEPLSTFLASIDSRITKVEESSTTPDLPTPPKENLV